MERAGDILRNILDPGAAETGERYHAFFSAWDSIVGDPLAGSSRVLDVDKGQLIVAVDHPGMLQILRFKEAEVLKSLKKRFPELELRAMRVIVRPLPPAAEGPPPQPVPQEEVAGVADPEVRERLAGISDQRLRASLTKLYGESLRRQGDDRGRRQGPGR